MRRISEALKDLVEEVNVRGITVRGRPLTPIQVSDLQDRWVISPEEWGHPGRPTGGSWTRYPTSAADTIEAIAKGLNEKRDTNRAILLAFTEGARVLDTGVRIAYTTYLLGLKKAVRVVSSGQKRLRFPGGLLLAPLDSLGKRALVDFAMGNKPIPEAIDALVGVLGLPADLRTAPPEASAIEYPSFEELLGSLGINRVMEKIHRADPAELAWAAQSVLTLFRYCVVMYRITSMTGSSRLPVASDDPEIVASAQHVFRTIVAGGRFIDRLMALSNKRTDVEIAALNAPVLLVAFDLFPADARATYDSVLDQMSQNLPRLLAIESLIQYAPADRRQFLSWESQAQLASMPPDEIKELRRIADSWGARNPGMLAVLVGTAL